MRPLFNSIASKLVLLALLIVCAIFLISAISAVGFNRVQNISGDLVDSEIEALIINAQLERRLAAVVLEIDQLSDQCGNSLILSSDTFKLRSQLKALSSNIPHPELSGAYQSFARSASTLLDHCELVNLHIIRLSQVEKNTDRHLLNLEQAIGEEVVAEALKGKDTNHLDQLMVLVVGLRETALEVSRDTVRYSSHEGVNAQNGSQIVSSIDDMSLRLQTLTASTESIARISQLLSLELSEYQQILDVYLTSQQQLNNAVTDVHNKQKGVLLLLDELEKAAQGRNVVVKDELGQIIDDSRLQVLGLAALIALITFLLVSRIIRKHINHPLHQLLEVIDSIKSQSATTDMPKRKDEWGVIGAHVIDMSEELTKSKERLDIAIKGTNAGLWDWNLETNLVYFSPRWKAMLGYEEHEIESSIETWERLIEPNDRMSALESLAGYLAGDIEFLSAEYRMKHKNGHWIYVLSRGKLALDEKGEIQEPKRLVGTHVDISKRKQAESELMRSEKEQRTLIAALPDIVLRLDEEGRHLFASDNVSEMSFISAEKFIGKTCRELGFPEMFCAQQERAITETFRTRETQQLEVELIAPEGYRVFEWILTPDIDDQGDVRSVLAVVRDTTELKRHQTKLEHIAHYDVLTSLPNRALFADRMNVAMSQALRQGHKLAIIYIDLDGFKEVNDTYGHVVGDQLLQTVSSRMQQGLRDSDTLARLGGDEFVAMLTGLSDENSCLDSIERLLSTASRPIRNGDLNLHVTASMGVTFYPQDEDLDADQLLRQADQAMYEAKRSGKNRYYLFDTVGEQIARSQSENIEQIRSALINQEFELYYQPKVNMKEGKVVGVEALIRWNHDGIVLKPSQFLPYIYEHQVGLEVDYWVICSALKQAAEWVDQGLILPVSINVSAAQLQQPEFLQNLKSCMAKYPTLPAELIELEVLESGALMDTLHTSNILKECVDLGVSIALDDFGTGYSSLTYLKTLPINTLKIDQSFIQGMSENKDDRAILEAILGLAKAFKLRVIAEGVERTEHGRMLIELGCDNAQGYVIAKPMPANEITEWLSSWRAPLLWLDNEDLSLQTIN